MRAEVPDGFSLKIVIRGGRWSFVISPLPVHNWSWNMYNDNEQRQEFTVTESGSFSDLAFLWKSGTLDEETGYDYIIIEYYENGAQTPTKIKKLYFDYDGDEK